MLLYARANTRQLGGGRYVQLTTSADGGFLWSSFQLIRFQCGHLIQDAAPDERRPSYDGIQFNGWVLQEIYTFIVKL